MPFELLMPCAGRRPRRAPVLAAAALGAILPSLGHAENFLTNPAFNVLGPSGISTSFTGGGLGGPSAADKWLVWNNSTGTTVTKLVDSTRVSGRRMLYVATDGTRNGLFQNWCCAVLPPKVYGCAWIYVLSGRVGIGTGFGGGTVHDAVLTKTGSWEVLNVGNGSSPAIEMIVYSYLGPARFYIESARVARSHDQCRPE
ncbi:MAG: hypothetical protein U1E52_16780 [Geminicoccaceae bacterium]